MDILILVKDQANIYTLMKTYIILTKNLIHQKDMLRIALMDGKVQKDIMITF